MIRKLLVPNRGEIAIRIARTCREMGIVTVIAHSSADAATLAVRNFDQAVDLGEGEARETYLDVGKVIDACRRSGADALHPGYGFLSERAELAAACADQGIVFVGPPAEAIELMGSKSDSRALMEKIGVPVVPGYHGTDQSDETLSREALGIGFPLLVKASAGGGGKGMKIVREESELRAALESARREAGKAFGNERLLLERYVEHPRHVEMQVFGDSEGNIVHLFERDCSVQRRHQKIIEESPAPHYPEPLRQKMAEAAIAAAGGVGYRNAGTVEFIVTPEREFYFLEMNTRLQVEHPVTELVVGVDLVRAQLEVAAGAALPWTQDELQQRGHAIECRIYAEDPDRGFLPQAGTIERYEEPAGPGIRVDSGVETGSLITVRYDPLLAKLIVRAEDRERCIDRMVRALEEYIILGTATNIPFLHRVLSHPAFRAGEVSTAFIPEHQEGLQREGGERAAAVATLLAELGGGGRRRATADAEVQGSPSVWDLVGSWGRG
ncbi:MAG: biotin carboxylase N-terminal domain-containing protein [Thermoanaerobaculia bacterium]